MPDEQEPQVLTLAEAAAFLRVSPRTIHRLLQRGELHGRKVGRDWRFRREDLDAYLREKKPAQ